MLSTDKKKFARAAIFGLVAMGACGSVAAADIIDWVDFGTWTDGQLTGSGFTSADGLEVTATFDNEGGTGTLRTSFPQALTVTLSDPLWPFDNDEIPGLVTIPEVTTPPGTVFTQDLTFEFTMDPLPIGGSVAIIDLDIEGSTVKVVGLEDDGMGGFTEVAVNWAVSFYQTDGVVVDPPLWDPITNTATGVPNSYDPGINNFGFLSSDRELDAVRFEISMVDNGEEADGIGFAVSRQFVPPPAEVPEPISLLLIGSGLAGLAVRRRRSAAARS